MARPRADAVDSGAPTAAGEGGRHAQASLAAEARRALHGDQHADEADDGSEQHRPAHPFPQEKNARAAESEAARRMRA